ncbi:MAG: 8-oxo-dGTP diphosphatase [Nitrososphaerales archaeon]
MNARRRHRLLNPPETIRAVICYVQRRSDRKYLLLHKAKGKFGEGFWNAPGGKIELAETPERAAVREIFEETGLILSDLEKFGELEFYFGEEKKKPDWTAVVFKTSTFKGELRKSEEGILRWFKAENFPLDQMWEDDRYWLPLLFRGVRFNGSFRFTSDSKKIISHEIKMI